MCEKEHGALGSSPVYLRCGHKQEGNLHRAKERGRWVSMGGESLLCHAKASGHPQVS